MQIPVTPQITVGYPDSGSGLSTNKIGRSHWLPQVQWCSHERLSAVSQMNVVGCYCCHIRRQIFLGAIQEVRLSLV